MKKFLLIGLLGLVGCGTTWNSFPSYRPTGNLPSKKYVCISVPYEQQAAVVEGIDVWNRAIRNWIRLVPATKEGGWCDYEIYEGESGLSGLPAAEETDELGGHKMVLVRGLYEQRTTDIVVHGIGHLLGAQHTMTGTMIIKLEFAPSGLCPDLTTVAQVAAYNHVSLEQFSWCEKGL